jgi:PAS domain S-box-containing protein
VPPGDGRDLPESLDEVLLTLPDHLGELIVVLDEEGDILWFNLAAEAVLGWPRTDWVGHNIVEVLHPGDVGQAYELLVSARATGPGVKEPVRYRMASAHDGFVEIEAVASTVLLASGRALLVCSARITGRARNVDFITGEVDERLWLVFERAVVGMAQVDLEGRVLRANHHLGEQLGVSPSSLTGVPLVGVVVSGDRSRVAREVALAASGEEPRVVRTTLDHRARPIEVHLSLVPDWLGEPLYLLAQLTRAEAPAG